MMTSNQPSSATQSDDARAQQTKPWVAPLECFVMVDVAASTLNGTASGIDHGSSISTHSAAS